MKTASFFKSYQTTFLKGDIVAGLTVGVLLIPQGMAYALIAGLPLIYGLYAGIVPGLVYAFLGTSKKLSVGPVALDSLLVFSGLTAMGFSSPQAYIEAALLLALLTGCVLLIFGVLSLGFLALFLSKPVVSGFTFAAVLLIVKSQLKYILGVDVLTFDKLGEIHVPTLLLALCSVLFLVLVKRFYKKVPAQILLLVLGVLVSYVFKFETLNINVVGSISEQLPFFKLPVITVNKVLGLLPIALSLAVISYTGAVSVSKSLEDKYNTNELQPNKELIALGFSNIIGSFFQSYSVTGGFSRTAVNDAAGANTKLAGVLSSVVVVVILSFFTAFFYHLPKVVLAAIIVVSVVGLIDVNYIKDLFVKRKTEFLTLVVTFLVTLFVGVKEGVFFGVVTSLLMMVYRVSKPHIAELGLVKGTAYFKNINRFTNNVEIEEDLLILRFDAQIYFGNKDFFRKQLSSKIKERGSVSVVVLNAESINYIDSSGVHMLKSLICELEQKNIRLFIAGAIGPIRDIFKTSGLLDDLGATHFFIDTMAAYRFFKENKVQTEMQSTICLQTQKKITHEY